MKIKRGTNNNIFLIWNKIAYFLFQNNKADSEKKSGHNENDIWGEDTSKNYTKVNIEAAVRKKFFLFLKMHQKNIQKTNKDLRINATNAYEATRNETSIFREH